MNRFPLRTLHRYVILSLTVFILVQLSKQFELSCPAWILNYLNDFLTIPLVATICLHGIWLIKRDQTIRLSLLTIISLVILYAFYFEYYLPKTSLRYTGDFWDVICYLSGGIVFYILQKKE